MYSGNRFKQISGNAFDLREEALPVRDHGQLGLGELLKVHHDDLLEVGHPVVLEQLHLHLGVLVMFFNFFEDTDHLDHFGYLLESVLTLFHPVFPLCDILDGRSHLVESTT